jgi:hypothetical protein
VYEGGDFIQCEIFEALPEMKRSQHWIAIDDRDLAKPQPHGRRSQSLSDTVLKWYKEKDHTYPTINGVAP